jgi:quercetin dioxygenase-like cupin family protein
MFDQTDAVSAAGPHHKVLFENARVRVLETIIRPGEQTALHTHVWSGTLLILSWSDFWRFDADGHVIFQSADLAVTPKAGDVIWTGPLPLHLFRNVGTQNFHVITTELKS